MTASSFQIKQKQDYSHWTRAFPWPLRQLTVNLLTDSDVAFVFSLDQCERGFAVKREMVQ